MISAISRTSVREIRPRTLCSRRRRTVESFLLSRHHLGLSCVANAFTLSAATQLRLSNEDEGDEEGEDDERAEGQGRGRGGGAEVRMHALRESRRGWGIIKCTLPRRLMMRKRSRGVTMEAHTRRACVRVSRGVPCMLWSCSDDRALPRGACPMWPCARGLLGAGPGGLLPQSLALEKEYRTQHVQPVAHM